MLHHSTIIINNVKLILVNIYGRNGMATEAIELYQMMPADIRDQRTYVCVINACSHAGLTTDARSIFEQIQIRDAHVVTTMVRRTIALSS